MSIGEIGKKHQMPIFIVYRIFQISTQYAYFGITRDWPNRKSNHLSLLRNGWHQNRLLQQAWNEAEESDFKFEIIETVKTERKALDRELYWINHKKGAFNIQGNGDRPEPVLVRLNGSFTPIEPQARFNLLRLVSLYGNFTDYKLSTISRRAHGDPRFFDMLLKEHEKSNRTDSRGSFTIRIYDKVVKWFYDNWPHDADFPLLDDMTYNINLERIHHGTPPGQQEQVNEGKSRNRQKAAQGKGESSGKGSASDLLRKFRRGK